MNADYKLIGQQISMYRHRAGLTQEQLAEVCNLSVSYINRIENGHKKPSLDVLITIADTLKTDTFKELWWTKGKNHNVAIRVVRK